MNVLDRVRKYHGYDVFPCAIERVSTGCHQGKRCGGCNEIIRDKFLLKVDDQYWHVSCLRCCVCNLALEEQQSCYLKHDNIYCEFDYTKEFGVKCPKCLRVIFAKDWVRKAREFTYHIACFACDSCKRQLSTGEEFALRGDRLLCKPHYIDLIEGGPGRESASSQKPKAKRVRTTFTEEQLQFLQAKFQLDSNPDGNDLEQIAAQAGLSKRVTQVWFQNSRARQKKYQQQRHKINGSTRTLSPPTGVNSSPPSLWASESDSQHSDNYPSE